MRLQRADGTLTDAGRHYHSAVGEDPPLMYSYEQPLINDKFVMGYSGRKVQVRRWKDGAWHVTNQGEHISSTTRMSMLCTSQSAEL